MHGMKGIVGQLFKAPRGLLLLLLLMCVNSSVHAQWLLRGMVVEDESDLPVIGATIKLPDYGLSTATDESGWFSVNMPDTPMNGEVLELRLLVNGMGFEDQEVVWKKKSHETVPLEIRMVKVDRILEEVIVNQPYSSRGNAAVELIRSVTANRYRNRSSSVEYLQYQAYNKIVMAVADLPGAFANNPLFRKYRFIFENVDTVSSPGRTLLPLYLEEKLSQEYRRRNPQGERSEVKAVMRTELDERFVNNDNIQAVVNFLHADMDLYDGNLLLFNRTFMSPIANGSYLFYKYAIRDTIIQQGREYVRVDFLPRNDQDRLFAGNVVISMDGRYAVREAFLHISRGAHINWINDMEIHYDYTRHATGMYLPSVIETKINFGILGSRQGLYSHWVQNFDHYQTQEISSQTFNASQVEESRLPERSQQYWLENRPIRLSEVEDRLYHNIDSLQSNPGFLNTLEWATFLATSFKRVGPVELGPLEYAYSHNMQEGSRFRVGGRLSRNISKRFYAEGYGAYGIKDDRFKYYGLAAISLNNREIAAFPAHYINFSYQNDLREPGMPLDFMNGDGLFRSFRRNRQNRWLYHQLFKAQHSVEFGNHWRVRTTLSTHRQETAGDLFFRKVSDDMLQPAIRTTEAVLELRWAPNEEYFQSNLRRTSISSRYPIFNFRYNVGFSGLLGGQYDYHALRFVVNKRFYMSFLGFSEVEMGAGYIFGQLPYPLLEIPMADQSYLLVPDSYSLMNNLEFVSDHYAKFSWQHRFQGFFVNKIPLLRKTGIRETVGAKVYFGQLRDENNPMYNSNLFYFPINDKGEQSTFSFGRVPYMEASVGLENIFNFLQIEYIKRLSYLDLPDARKDGLRFSVNIGF